ncbi:hypothetical protein EIN_372370 [Entamoeba invadens IP1]|uniref:Uncharacterized protein n=1 Tax=Entamoeba invadens IP1 TaxID=370355 RepID=A0A0A1UC48_ENTIV|nr:hypothetical protein EIN_372370 [Entamoeba invadens IP1]ELP92815.1 hypothetical protein EIN_372370 [Entamoeba invadens IP1]|eukprot:XP_004259586.1 hypothetical protein EIN_372370 [Entamoeba invadens IP1]
MFRKQAHSTLSVVKSFGGWTSTPQTKESPTVSRESIDMNHPVIEALKKHVNLLDYVIHNRMYILLPPAILLKDIPITNTFLLSHIIYISPNFQFVSLNGICGKFNGQKVCVFASPYRDEHDADLLNFKMKSVNELFPIFSTQVSRLDYFSHGNFKVMTLFIKFPICENEVPWNWKVKPVQMTSPPSFSLFKQFMELETCFVQIRKLLPCIEAEEEKDEMVHSGRFPKYFHLDFSENRMQSLRQTEMDIAKFYSKMSYNDSLHIVKRMMQFITNFPGLVENKSLRDRRLLLTEFLEEMTELVKNDVMWNDDAGFNKLAFQSCLDDFLVAKLYRCFWPPSILALEKVDVFDCEVHDCLYQTTCSEHLYFTPRDYGYLGPLDSFNVIVPFVVKLLRKIDTVRTASGKAVCVFCAMKVVEQFCYYLGEKFENDNLFPMIMTYCIIQADLSHIKSNIVFIKNVGMNVDLLFMHYFENFELLTDGLKVISVKFVGVNKDVYSFLKKQRIAETGWVINKTQTFTQCTDDNLKRFFGAFCVRGDLRSVIFSNPSKFQRDDYVELLEIFRQCHVEM